MQMNAFPLNNWIELMAEQQNEADRYNIIKTRSFSDRNALNAMKWSMMVRSLRIR